MYLFHSDEKSHHSRIEIIPSHTDRIHIVVGRLNSPNPLIPHSWALLPHNSGNRFLITLAQAKLAYNYPSAFRAIRVSRHAKVTCVIPVTACVYGNEVSEKDAVKMSKLGVEVHESVKNGRSVYDQRYIRRGRVRSRLEHSRMLYMERLRDLEEARKEWRFDQVEYAQLGSEIGIQIFLDNLHIHRILGPYAEEMSQELEILPARERNDHHSEHHFLNRNRPVTTTRWVKRNLHESTKEPEQSITLLDLLKSRIIPRRNP